MLNAFYFRNCRKLMAIGFALLLLSLNQAAHAASFSPCSEPAVFQGAAVNLFVLPYRYVESKDNPALERASRQISGLVHLQLLYSMLKYGAVGGTVLESQPGEVCDVNDVIKQVSAHGGPGVLRRGQTLVEVWGRIFEQDDQFYVQTYVRFLRQGRIKPVPETISVDLKGEGFDLPLTATLPTQALAFPPRRISQADLTEVVRKFRAAMVVRPQPTLSAEGQSIDYMPEHRFPYGVTKTRKTAEGEWMWIQPMEGGPAGWVLARSADHPQDWLLERWLPELSYIDAIHGFMRLQAGIAFPLSARKKEEIPGWIDEGFASYEGAVGADEASAAYGLARAIRGFVIWQSQPNAAGRAEAARLFAQTRGFMPEYAAALNLAGVTETLTGDGVLSTEAIDKLNRDLLGAIALDPRNTLALENLDKLYAAFEAQPAISPYKKKELTTRITVVQSALKSLNH